MLWHSQRCGGIGRFKWGSQDLCWSRSSVFSEIKVGGGRREEGHTCRCHCLLVRVTGCLPVQNLLKKVLVPKGLPSGLLGVRQRASAEVSAEYVYLRWLLRWQTLMSRPTIRVTPLRSPLRLPQHPCTRPRRFSRSVLDVRRSSRYGSSSSSGEPRVQRRLLVRMKGLG